MSASRSILVLRALGLGDALTGVAALRGLRRAHPRGQLVLAAPAPLGCWLRSHGIVDDVVPAHGLEPLPWRGAAPDVAVNLHGRGPQSHSVLRRLEPGRLVAFAHPEVPEQDPPGPAWPTDLHEVDRWCSLVTWAGGPCDARDLRLSAGSADRGTHVVLHPGAASGARRWPVARWRAVAAALSSTGRDVVVTGTSPESRWCAEVAAAHPRARDACGRLGLSDLSELVGSAALLLCGDTGLAHLATAHGTPSVLLFGPTSPALWGPRIDRERHLVLWHPQAADPPGDPHGSRLDARLARIGVDEVLRAATGLLSQPRARPV